MYQIAEKTPMEDFQIYFDYKVANNMVVLHLYMLQFYYQMKYLKICLKLGKMQKLYLGSEYSVTAKLEYNKKYDSWQYVPISITANTPKDYAAQLLFLKAMIGLQKQSYRN